MQPKKAKRSEVRTCAVRAGAALLVAAVFAGAASKPLMAAPDQAPLRVGIQHLPHEPGPAEFRVYTPEGFEALLAERLAAQLGRKLKLVQLSASDESLALSGGKVDVVLGRRAARTDTDVLAVVDSGFRSGLTVAMRTDTDIKSWADLKGRTVCITRGNADALALAFEFDAQPKIQDSPAQSLVLVRTGECDAAIHDAVLLGRLFQETGWQKFSATLPVTQPTALVAAVRPDEPLAAEVKTALAQVGSASAWDELGKKWARNVAFEVYLDQDAPDCH